MRHGRRRLRACMSEMLRLDEDESVQGDPAGTHSIACSTHEAAVFPRNVAVIAAIAPPCPCTKRPPSKKLVLQRIR